MVAATPVVRSSLPENRTTPQIESRSRRFRGSALPRLGRLRPGLFSDVLSHPNRLPVADVLVEHARTESPLPPARARHATEETHQSADLDSHRGGGREGPAEPSGCRGVEAMRSSKLAWRRREAVDEDPGSPDAENLGVRLGPRVHGGPSRRLSVKLWTCSWGVNRLPGRRRKGLVPWVTRFGSGHWTRVWLTITAGERQCGASLPVKIRAGQIQEGAASRTARDRSGQRTNGARECEIAADITRGWNWPAGRMSACSSL